MDSELRTDLRKYCRTANEGPGYDLNGYFEGALSQAVQDRITGESRDTTIAKIEIGVKGLNSESIKNV